MLHRQPAVAVGFAGDFKQDAACGADCAAADLVEGLAFGPQIQELLAEYRAGVSAEARLARDADQLALVLELKDLDDIGYRSPQTWLPHVLKRLQTETGKALAQAVMNTRRDAWWWPAAQSQEPSA